MAVISSGKYALSEILEVETTGKVSLCKIAIKTGRMHQIRVHLSTLGYPIVGDKVYGSKKKDADLVKEDIPHHLLHAQHLAFQLDEEKMEFTKEAPSIFHSILEKFRKKNL